MRHHSRHGRRGTCRAACPRLPRRRAAGDRRWNDRDSDAGWEATPKVMVSSPRMQLWRRWDPHLSGHWLVVASRRAGHGGVRPDASQRRRRDR
jgi:hypothetical protein